jgi:hypothetical protein
MNTTLPSPARREFLNLIATLPLVPASKLLPGQGTARHSPTPRAEPTPDFTIAGYQYHDGPRVHEMLYVGAELHLRAEPDNPHDPLAIEILFGDAKLGYVPRACNRQLCQLLQDGVALHCTVGQLNPLGPVWEVVRVHVTPIAGLPVALPLAPTATNAFSA